MSPDPGAIVRAEPLAYFLTWTTYGSWLPGDDRGWVDRRGVFRDRDPAVRNVAIGRLVAPPVSLTRHQRSIVEHCVSMHAANRGWQLHAVTCRSQHVHVVVSASGRPARQVLVGFKAWSTRVLSTQGGNEGSRRSRRWWTRGGSVRTVFDEQSLVNVVTYVCECQDRSRGR